MPFEEENSEKIAMVGLGRVGLPLALAFLEKGFFVVGVDVNEKKLEQLRKGEMPFSEKGAEPILRRWIQKRFTVTSDLKGAVSEAGVIILTLGTPIDEHMNPIFEQIESTMVKMAPFLKAGHLIVLRSTVYPGTTEQLKRFIERETRLIVGETLFLACCPERIAEGNSLEELAVIPQIVGTLDEASSLKAQHLFKHLTSKIIPSDARSAELAKLFCNMYRYIEFAMANEFMMIADNYERNIYEIIELVNRDYVRGGLKKPGFAGGPCLYKDGFFLINDIPYNELISIAWKINETVPAYLIHNIKIRQPLEGRKVVILGLSFKRDIDDNRNSLSYKAKKIFLKEGAQVFLHDPYLKPGDLGTVLQDAEVLLVAVNHRSYQELSLEKIGQWVKPGCIICDIWNLFGTNRILFQLENSLLPQPVPLLSSQP
ncbi:MAG: nucleotide sugar dehydrogenase [Candidatus Omnitrophica bacterium]|nr:nucleotide sugar dehydrogenase [Candidatus Omnitrophota bacterium]